MTCVIGLIYVAGMILNSCHIVYMTSPYNDTKECKISFLNKEQLTVPVNCSEIYTEIEKQKK